MAALLRQRKKKEKKTKESSSSCKWLPLTTCAHACLPSSLLGEELCLMKTPQPASEYRVPCQDASCHALSVPLLSDGGAVRCCAQHSDAQVVPSSGVPNLPPAPHRRVNTPCSVIFGILAIAVTQSCIHLSAVHNQSVPFVIRLHHSYSHARWRGGVWHLCHHAD